MWCSECGKKLEEGSIFCEYCGCKIEDIIGEENTAPNLENASAFQDESQDEQSIKTGAGTEKNMIFCPNCGKKSLAEERFCDECGTSLHEDMTTLDQAVSSSMASGKKIKKRFLISAAIVVVGVCAAVVVIGRGGSNKFVQQNRVVYFKDSSMMMTKLQKKAEPKEITDSWAEYDISSNVAGMINTQFLSKDGKYLFYIEDCTDESFDLFQARVSKLDDAVKIDSNVNDVEILNNNSVFYEKKGAYYLYNGKDKLKFGKDVGEYRLDEGQNNVLWEEHDGDGYYDLYYQSLDQKKDKVKLDSGISRFYCDRKLKVIYGVKDDAVIKYDVNGNKDKVIKKAINVLGCDAETGTIYFVREGEYELDLANHVYGTAGYPVKSSNALRIPTYELYCYTNGTEKLISDRMAHEARKNSYGGKYCMFQETVAWNDLSIPWEKISYADGNSERLAEAVAEYINKNDLTTKVASTAGIFFADEKINRTESTYYYKDSEILYMIVREEDDEDGTILYSLALGGSQDGKLEEVDRAVDYISGVSKEGVYYLKDYNDYSGDLCLNGKIIIPDAFLAVKIKDSEGIVCMVDYSSRHESGTVMIYENKKVKKVDDDISYVDVGKDGTLLMLSDYDLDRYEGDLRYYNGKETYTLDDEVIGFAVRYGSSTIR